MLNKVFKKVTALVVLGGIMLSMSVPNLVLAETTTVTAKPSKILTTLRSGNVAYAKDEYSMFVQPGMDERQKDKHLSEEFEFIQMRNYMMDGFNYTRLTDLAALLDFNVDYDAKISTTVIDIHKHYVGDAPVFEFAERFSKKPQVWAKTAPDVSASKSNTKFKLADGDQLSLNAYNINGHDYVKLADIMKALDMGMLYVPENNAVVLNPCENFKGERVYKQRLDRFTPNE